MTIFSVRHQILSLLVTELKRLDAFNQRTDCLFFLLLHIQRFHYSGSKIVIKHIMRSKFNIQIIEHKMKVNER